MKARVKTTGKIVTITGTDGICLTDENDFALFIGEEMVTHWQEIVTPQED